MADNLFWTLRAAGRWALIAVAQPARAEVAVSYGHRILPGPGDAVTGGIVKFQRLQGAFPNRPLDFNVLYLGSSSLPADASRLIALARRRRAAVVLNQNGVAYPAWAGERTAALNAPLAEALQAAGHVLYQSAFCKEAADRFIGQPSGAWEVLHNPVDTTAFTPAAATPAGGPVLLTAGKPGYRLEAALRTVELLADDQPGVRLIVAGELGGKDAALVRELGLEARVDLLGRYAQRDAPLVFSRAHLLLHPKVNDPCPNVVLEAMACGLPVVHSASGGTLELVGDAGVAVPSSATWEQDVPPGPLAMADGVRAVLERLDDYRELARARAVERFDLAPWIERHRALFTKVAGV